MGKINDHTRGKPTTVRFWPDDEEWIRDLARRRRVPLSLLIDEALTLYRHKIEDEDSQSAVFEAVARAKV